MSNNLNPDNQYINIPFYVKKNNINDPDVPCVIYTNSLSPLLKEANKYSLSIARIHTDSQNIPIFIPSIVPNQNNVNLTNYILQINDLDPVNLVYVPKNKYKFSVPSTAGLDSPYYWVYDILQVVDMFNTACLSAVGNSGIEPPIMVYNNDNTFSIYFDSSFTSTNTLYVNEYLYNLFRNFSFNFVSNNGLNFSLNATNRLTNTTTINSINYIFEKQNYPSFSIDWNPVSSLVITTTTIPIVPETRIPAINISGNVSNTVPDPEPQITDIVLNVDNPNDYNSNITYNANTDYRSVSITSDTVQEIEIKMFWRSKKGILYPLLMSEGNAGNIKIKFQKIF